MVNTVRSDVFADAAARMQAQRPLRKARLQQIASQLRSGRIADAEQELNDYLGKHAEDADALRLLARAVNLLGRPAEAASLLRHCLELAPDFIAARFQFAKLLLQVHAYRDALSEAERLLAVDGNNPLFRQLKAEVLRFLGEDESSLAICEQLAAENPDHAECWIRYGDALRSAGSQEKCVAAYRGAIACRPSFGLAWWSLANLKTVRFDEADIEAMQEQLKRRDIGSDDRINLMFALGKALEDRCAWDQSFSCYAKANAARRLAVDHDWDAISARLTADRVLFTTEFLASRSGVGCQAPDAIFVLGRPRSGSTLIEQILASHSAVEGTAELPYIADIVIRLEEAHAAHLPQILAKLDSEALATLGEEYLSRAAMHRKTNRPFFIDKAPANYHQIGLILLMLPNAKIIDARRHPVASCFSMFKHNYTDSNLRLSELGRVYRDYVTLFAHFDHASPGRIRRVIYEDMVTNPESEIRGLLDYLGLPFEESCLRFHETKRTIRTPSSEQVRRPITAEAVDHWRNFEPWLGQLLESLGSVLSAYPAVPRKLSDPSPE